MAKSAQGMTSEETPTHVNSKNCQGLFPWPFQVLSFDEICSQGEISDAALDQNSESKGSQPVVISTFDDICALHGLVNTTQWEQVEFVDMLGVGGNGNIAEETTNYASTGTPSLPVPTIGKSLPVVDLPVSVTEQIEKSGKKSQENLQYSKIPRTEDTKCPTNFQTIQGTGNAVESFNPEKSKSDKSGKISQATGKKAKKLQDNRHANNYHPKRFKNETKPEEKQMPLPIMETRSSTMKFPSINSAKMKGIVQEDISKGFSNQRNVLQDLPEISTTYSPKGIDLTVKAIVDCAHDQRQKKRVSGKKLESICQKLMKIQDDGQIQDSNRPVDCQVPDNLRSPHLIPDSQVPVPNEHDQKDGKVADWVDGNCKNEVRNEALALPPSTIEFRVTSEDTVAKPKKTSKKDEHSPGECFARILMRHVLTAQ